MSVQARTQVEMVNYVKSRPAVKINGEILDTSLVLKFQPMKTYFGGASDQLREIYHLFKPSSGQYIYASLRLLFKH